MTFEILEHLRSDSMLQALHPIMYAIVCRVYFKDNFLFYSAEFYLTHTTRSVFLHLSIGLVPGIFLKKRRQSSNCKRRTFSFVIAFYRFANFNHITTTLCAFLILDSSYLQNGRNLCSQSKLIKNLISCNIANQLAILFQ